MKETPFLLGPIVAEDNPLTRGLNWQSLLVREGMIIPTDSRDRVLLWQGERPLISLRSRQSGVQQLLLHFDLVTSNARKLPALAVLLHRFLESQRQSKVAMEAGNFDLRQRLQVAVQSGGPPLTLKLPSGRVEEVPLKQKHLLRAPAEPGFFEVRQGNVLLLAGAAHFADTREADLSGASAYDDLGQVAAKMQEVSHEKDGNWRLWLLFLLGLLMASWWFIGSRAASKPQPRVTSLA